MSKLREKFYTNQYVNACPYYQYARGVVESAAYVMANFDNHEIAKSLLRNLINPVSPWCSLGELKFIIEKNDYEPELMSFYDELWNE